MKNAKIIDAMELSALAYKDIQPVYSNVSLAVIDDRCGVQCYLRRQAGTICISFRGSNSAEDWKTNLRFWKKTIPYGNTRSKIRVHSGFLYAYKNPLVRESIHGKMSEDIKRILITGHSQGAALAVLCAVDLEYNFPEKDIEVILFGCPRVGNGAFVRSYNKRVCKTVRVENGNDIVTKVPPKLLGYCHVGAKLHIGAVRIPGFVSLRAHYPHEYYAKLIKAML
ncbi:MAG: lipase family protein [Clostridiales bacterium]|nr:lipase family protein [Clostridiales bacterium]